MGSRWDPRGLYTCRVWNICSIWAACGHAVRAEMSSAAGTGKSEVGKRSGRAGWVDVEENESDLYAYRFAFDWALLPNTLVPST